MSAQSKKGDENHALEHLGATDRGVTMFRQDIWPGIRRVREGLDPAGLCRDAGMVTPTYANDTVVHVPPASTLEEDSRLLRETGRRLAEAYLKNPPLVVVHEPC